MSFESLTKVNLVSFAQFYPQPGFLENQAVDKF